MSTSIEDLLDSPEDNGDFDIGDEEEEALLDDNFDITTASKGAINESVELDEAEEQDEHDFVLDLDNTTDFNEDDDEHVRQDRFQSERPVQQVEAIKELVTQPNRQEFRNTRMDFRGRRPYRGVYRGNSYHNAQRRANFQNNNVMNKRVLINPHFKGQVPIRNNVSLVWDKNTIKKPSLPVQPWAHTVRPQQNVPWIRQTSVFNGPYPQSQISAAIPIQHKIGIPSNIFVPPVSNPQYFQPPNVNVINPPAFQQAAYPQPAQLITSQYGANYNAVGQFAVPQYNVQQSVVGPYNSSATMCLNPAVASYTSAPSVQPVHRGYRSRYDAQPPAHAFQRTFAVKREALEDGASLAEGEPPRRSLCNMGPQARRRYQQNIDGRGPRSNLQEIKTSDNVTSENQHQANIQVKIEKDAPEEDETMTQYRRLIENQKQLREKILRRKEERRKNAAKSAQSEEEADAPAPPKELLKTVDFVTVDARSRTNLVVPTLTVTKSSAASGKPLAPRAVREPVSDAVDKSAISSFLSNRKIIAKDDALPDTSVVVVSNLATGSTEVKLRRLCKGVGDVKNLVMSPLERLATIQFKSVASAHAFYKKYQRFMLDLSMIQVTLKEPKS